MDTKSNMKIKILASPKPPTVGVGCSGWFGSFFMNLRGELNMDELASWYEKQKRDHVRNLILCDLAGMSAGHIKKSTEIVVENLSGGCEHNHIDSSVPVNGVASGETSFYQKVRRAFHRIFNIIVHRNPSLPNVTGEPRRRLARAMRQHGS